MSTLAIPLKYSGGRIVQDVETRPKSPTLPTKLFMMYAFAIYSGALTPSIRYARGEEQLPPGQSEIANTLSQILILAVMAHFVFRNHRAISRHVRVLLPYVAIVGLCVASIVWSQFPVLTCRRCVTLCVCVLFGIFCHEKAGLRNTIGILGTTTLCLCIMSIVVYFAVPGVGHEVALGYSSAMRGVYAQKNTLGSSALLGIVCYAYRLLQPRGASAKPVAALLVLLACILMAKSATSLVIALLVLGISVTIVVNRLRAGPIITYGMFSVLAIFLFVCVADPALLFAIAQRDSSFTGRVPLWQMALSAVWAKPWLGYGYSAFWNENSRVVQYIWEAIEWNAPSAHNGYIDILLQIGIPGMMLYAWLWTRITQRSLWLARRGLASESRWILLFMVVNVLLNMDEGPLPYPDQFTAMMPAILIFLGEHRSGSGKNLSPVQREG